MISTWAAWWRLTRSVQVHAATRRSVMVVVSIVGAAAACATSKVAEHPDLPPVVRAELELTRSRRYAESLVRTTAYLATAGGRARSEERCAMLVVAAFSEAMLKQVPAGDRHLLTFDSECAAYPLRYGWHAEAQRVRRLLAGEPATRVYVSARPDVVP